MQDARSTRRQDAAPQLADLERQRTDAERHLKTHPCDGARAHLADIERQEADLYRWIAEEEDGG